MTSRQREVVATLNLNYKPMRKAVRLLGDVAGEIDHVCGHAKPRPGCPVCRLTASLRCVVDEIREKWAAAKKGK